MFAQRKQCLEFHWMGRWLMSNLKDIEIALSKVNALDVRHSFEESENG